MFIIGMLLSVLVGVALGLLGGGGSILTLPILVYALGMEEKAAIATSLLVVGVTSAAAVLSHARAGNVEWKIGLLFAGAGSAGAFLGGYAAGFFEAAWLIRGFLMMMVGTAIAMLRGRKEVETKAGPLPIPKILLEGLAVGVVAGLVGAGGGFLVVPALTLLGGLSMQKAVGSSLVVITIQSFFGFQGQITHVQVDYLLAAEVSAAAVAGSVIGGYLARRVPQTQLRRGFGIFVLLMAAYMAYKQL